MRKVMIPGVREVHYSRLQEDCGIHKTKEAYSKTLVKAESHVEAMAFFRECIADEEVVKVLTTGAVYVYVDDDEAEQLEWM